MSLHSIRHVITPSISYSYQPDFSKTSIFGLEINYIDSDNNNQSYDYFKGSLVSSTPSGERQSYTFNLNNDFYGKFYNNDQYTKIHLLSLKSSVSYNAKADSLQWSYISSSLRTNLSNYLNIDVNLKHDLYKKISGIRINEFESIPRLVNINSGINFKLNGKKLIGLEEQYNNETDTSYFNENIDSTDYSIPPISSENAWEASFSFRGSIKPSYIEQEESEKNFWLQSNFNINVTNNWAVSYNARFDLLNSELLSHNFFISRQLHCWIFNFSWYPGVGSDNFGSGFRILIRVKNPDLQDVRIRQTKGNMFGAG